MVERGDYDRKGENIKVYRLILFKKTTKSAMTTVEYVTETSPIVEKKLFMCM